MYESGLRYRLAQKIATEFSKKYNVNVGVTNGSNNGEMNSNVENRQSEYDIVMTTGAQFRLADAKAVHDLREIYNYKPDGGDKTVAQKMNQKIYDMLLQEDGSIYFMNWANSLQGLFYNMTTLREVYGEDFSESQLPKTTGELIDMAKDISSKDGYVAFSASTGVTYWDYCVDAWGRNIQARKNITTIIRHHIPMRKGICNLQKRTENFSLLFRQGVFQL